MWRSAQSWIADPFSVDISLFVDHMFTLDGSCFVPAPVFVRAKALMFDGQFGRLCVMRKRGAESIWEIIVSFKTSSVL